jgi:predicted PurR-regulated permease PerM
MVETRNRAISVGIVAAVAVLAVLYFCASIFAPVAFALFIIAIVWPVQRRLQTAVPQLLALAIVMCIIAVGLLAFASIVAWGFSRIGRSLIADAPRFQGLYDQASVWLEGHGIVVAGLWAEHFDVRWFLRLLQGLTGRLNTMFSFLVVVLIYVLLGLLEVGSTERKIRVVFNGETASLLIDGSRLTAAKFRRYLFIRTIMSVATGVMVWVLAAVFGLQFAAEWGVMAFTLNYIPFIGPFIATLLPTLYALAQFESLQSALFVFACLNIIQFVIGSYIEPRVAGSALAISPFIVLFSVFLWVFLWGLFGAFIGVPITIAVLTYCAQSPSTAWLAGILGAPTDEQFPTKAV